MQSQPRPQWVEEEAFERVRELLYQRTGILFEDGKQEYVMRRVQEHMQGLLSPSFTAYLTDLRSEASGRALQQLINLVTVNETYFFREEYQLRCLVQSILPEVVRRRGLSRSLRIWSIPCSTGEEPYSLAIYLLEHWPPADSFSIQIVGSDIDTDALRAAGSGRFAPRSVERLPQPLIKKYFELAKDGSYEICEPLRRSVDLGHVNLADPLQTVACRDFDVIFCRNLLIYFDDASRTRASDTLFQALRPGGFICLGHSESMGRISSRFLMRRFPEAIVYQRPLEPESEP